MTLRFVPTAIAGAFQVRHEVRSDPRGRFRRLYCEQEFAVAGLNPHWVQVNQSVTLGSGSIRGMHFQRPPHAETKLVGCTLGRAFDVAVDLRRGSPTFGRWHGALLSDENHEQMWVPPGFAHGYLALGDVVDVIYKVTAPHDPDDARVLSWDDPDVGVAWPLAGPPQLSAQDAVGTRLSRAEVYP